MSLLKQKFFQFVVFSVFAFLFSLNVPAQSLSFNYFYKLDFAQAYVTEPPTFPNGFPEFAFPAAARKNGVEGTLKITVTLGEDAKVRDLIVEQPLPFGVTEAISKDLQNLRFQPAKSNGKPVAVKMYFDYVVAANYAENSGEVSKPKITEKPAPVYPEKYRAEKTKGKVSVSVLFYPNGKLEVVGVNSTMPKEFDRAAKDAAQNIKFTPATHKKSKKPVAQTMTVEYDFKP